MQLPTRFDISAAAVRCESAVLLAAMIMTRVNLHKPNPQSIFKCEAANLPVQEELEFENPASHILDSRLQS